MVVSNAIQKAQVNKIFPNLLSDHLRLRYLLKYFLCLGKKVALAALYRLECSYHYSGKLERSEMKGS